MAYDLYTGAPDDEQAKVAYFMLLFNQVRVRRVNFENQWEESAALYWPEYRNSFTFGHVRPPGVKQTQFQVDSTGTIAAHRFMSIADALMTPHSMLWSQIKADNKDLMKDKSVAKYFFDVTEALWAQRYRAEANFMGQNQINWHALGVFGNMGMIVDELDTRPGNLPRGLRYMACSPGEIYILQNHQGRVDGFIRHFRWTARQAYQRWGNKVPPFLLAAVEKNSQELYDFLQFVIPRTDYNPNKVLSLQSFPWTSIYVSVVGYCILEEGGYRSFPLAYGRYQQAPEEEYGRGPGQMVLPEAKTLNAEKAAYLKQGHRASDPSYLVGDDGLFDFKTHPGSYNYGGVSEDGKPLVHLLPIGDIQVTIEMMEQSKGIINDAFLVSLYPLLFNEKGAQRSNTMAVIEEASQRGIFLAPTLGRQFGEYLPMLIDRELDLLSYLKLLPKMPPALKEAGGDYKVIFSSPLARALESQEISSFMQMIDVGNAISQATGDKSYFDKLDTDAFYEDAAEKKNVPPGWIRSDQAVADIRKAREHQAERDRQVKELPGRAAMAKAKAIVAKAQTGGNTGGALSGTPTGGMPMMPGQSEPGGRDFGAPG